MKKTNPKPISKEPEPKVPTDLRKFLASNLKVKAEWKNLTPIARRDFVSWIDGAKQPETRERRVKRTCEMLEAGKRRPCCYAVVPMDIYKALGANSKAKAGWKNLTPTERRDFTDWVDEAKHEEIRKSRIEKTCVMLSAGKRHL